MRSYEDASGIETVIWRQARRYPRSEIQDFYKLIHQAAMGTEHAIPDPEAARKWLDEEINSLTELLGEPLSEAISPNGQMVRVHLRPFRQTGLETDILLEAFINTGLEYKSDQYLITDYAETLNWIVRQGFSMDYVAQRGGSAGKGSDQPAEEARGGFRPDYFHQMLGDYLKSHSDEVRVRLAGDFLANMAAQGYPAVKHSKSYRDAYQPAYRVVWLPASGAVLREAIEDGLKA